MKELIKITEKVEDNNLIQTVNARDVWGELKVKKDFSDWIKVQFKRGRFKENSDFILLPQKGEDKKGRGNKIDYHLTVDTAKHIAMMSNTKQGHMVREYFIKCEKRLMENAISYKKIRGDSIKQRNTFTQTLKEHGYSKPGHYIQTTKQMKGALNIKVKKKDMTELELKKVLAAELIAEVNIEQKELTGYHEVNPVCVDGCRAVEMATSKRIGG